MTMRRECSMKNIQRPKRLRRLYQSNVLENYIRELFFNTKPTSSASSSSTDFIRPQVSENPSALIPQYTTGPTANFFSPPPTTINRNNNNLLSTFFAASSSSSSTVFTQPPSLPVSENPGALNSLFSVNPTTTFFSPPPTTTTTNHYYNNLILTSPSSSSFSTTTTPFIQSMFPLVNENPSALIPQFSVIPIDTFFSPPPTTKTNNQYYNNLISTSCSSSPSSITTALIQSPLPLVSENPSPLISQFTAIPTTTFSSPSPTATSTTVNQNYNDLIPTFSATPFSPPPFTQYIEDNPLFEVISSPFPQSLTRAALSLTPSPIVDLALSADDYDTDSIKHFSFEGAVTIDKNHKFTTPSFTFESAVCYDDAGDEEYVIATTSCFAAETVHEEKEFMRSLFEDK